MTHLTDNKPGVPNMFKLPLLVLTLMMSLCCRAQTMVQSPTMKGHTLGETLEQFAVGSSLLTRQQIIRCASPQKGNGIQAKMARYDCEGFLRTGNAGGNGTFECDEPRYDQGVCRDFEGRVTFSSNKLVELTLKIVDKPWPDALSDVSMKFGNPDETQTDTLQNAYGAKLDLQRAVWIKPVYVLVTSEKINTPGNSYRFVEVTLTNRAYWEAKHKKQTSNALDR